MDEAVEATKQADDYELVRVADLFVEFGQDEVAGRFLRERMWRSRNPRVQEWVRK